MQEVRLGRSITYAAKRDGDLLLLLLLECFALFFCRGADVGEKQHEECHDSKSFIDSDADFVVGIATKEAV